MNRFPRILAIETSGRLGSVAIASGPDLLASRQFTANQRHAVELLPTMAALCSEAGWSPESIQQVYVSAGPGSFTGLRIGITLARTLAHAGEVRVVAVETVDVLASNALLAEPPPQNLAIVLDAKRQQIYTAAFRLQDDRYAKTHQACVADPLAFFEGLPRPLAVLGEGIPYHQEAANRAGVRVLPETHWRARAEAVHRLGYDHALAGRFADPAQLVPIYIRPPEAEEKWAAKIAKGSSE